MDAAEGSISVALGWKFPPGAMLLLSVLQVHTSTNHDPFPGLLEAHCIVSPRRTMQVKWDPLTLRVYPTSKKADLRAKIAPCQWMRRYLVHISPFLERNKGRGFRICSTSLSVNDTGEELASL